MYEYIDILCHLYQTTHCIIKYKQLEIMIWLVSYLLHLLMSYLDHVCCYLKQNYCGNGHCTVVQIVFYPFITTRMRSMRQGNVFTGVCLFTEGESAFQQCHLKAEPPPPQKVDPRPLSSEVDPPPPPPQKADPAHSGCEYCYGIRSTSRR